MEVSKNVKIGFHNYHVVLSMYLKIVSKYKPYISTWNLSLVINASIKEVLIGREYTFYSRDW